MKFLCSFLSLFVTVLFVSFGDNLNKGGAKWDMEQQNRLVSIF